MTTTLQTYSRLTAEVNRRTGELAAAKKDLREADSKLIEASQSAELHSHECDALRIAEELLRERVRNRVEKLVTMALKSVFGDGYRFWLDLDHKRGQATATPMIEFPFKGNKVSAAVQDAKGGGIVNVTGFVLQTVVLVLTRPKLARVVVLDEIFKNVSREYLPKVAELLQTLSKLTKVQFILVTHKLELSATADRVFNVTKTKDGITKVGIAS